MKSLVSSVQGESDRRYYERTLHLYREENFKDAQRFRGPRSPLSKAQQAEALQFRREGLSVSELCDRFRVSEDVMRVLLRKHGLSTLPKEANEPPKTAKERRAEETAQVLSIRAQGKTVDAIAAEVGISPATVWKRLKANGCARLPDPNALPEEERARIRQMGADGLGACEIARRVGRGQATVSRILRAAKGFPRKSVRKVGEPDNFSRETGAGAGCAMSPAPRTGDVRPASSNASEPAEHGGK